jgi:hypothetical protein
MPWEHVAVGYVLYSLSRRFVTGEPPTGAETVLLLVATQLPDLIDKPLSWGLGWFTTGHGMVHSLFVAVPVGLTLFLLAHRLRRPALGAAVLVGYWSHLLADVVSPLRSGGALNFGAVLWPVAEPSPYETDYGLWRSVVYIGRFVDGLSSVEPLVLLSYLLLPVLAFALWLADGAPGLAGARRYVQTSG